MSAIISGTTPTIEFAFSTINVEDIVSAYLTIKSSGRTMLEKGLELATVTPALKGGTVAWTLGQSETLKLRSVPRVEVCCDWKTSDGTRGRSTIETYTIEKSGKNVEI